MEKRERRSERHPESKVKAFMKSESTAKTRMARIRACVTVSISYRLDSTASDSLVSGSLSKANVKEIMISAKRVIMSELERIST